MAREKFSGFMTNEAQKSEVLEVRGLTPASPHNWMAVPSSEELTDRTRGVVNTRIGMIIGIQEVKFPNFSYDAPSIAEQIGAVSVPFYKTPSEVLIGITENHRPIANCTPEQWNLIQAQAIEQQNPDLISPFLGRTNWETPRGMGSKTLTSLETAFKELEEEIGAIGLRSIPLGSTFSNSAFLANQTDIFAIEITSTSNLKPQLEEGITNINFVDIDEVDSMIIEGQMQCALSETAIARFKIALKKGLI